MKTRLLLGLSSTLLLALPLTVLLPGCGGSSADNNFGTFNSTVPLSATQTGYVALNTGGVGVNGFFRVAANGTANAEDKSTQQLGFTLPLGNYAFLGSFSAPFSFNASGTIQGGIPFTIVGQIPVNGGNGNYTITVGGQTVRGTFSAGNRTATPTGTATVTPVFTTTATPVRTATARPTATNTPVTTPTPTSTAPGADNNSVQNITFFDVAGVNATSTAPFSATLRSNSFFKNSTGSGFVGTAFFESKVGNVTRKLTFEGPIRTLPVVGSEIIPFGGGEGSQANLYYSEVGPDKVEKSWAAISGTYVVVSGTNQRVTFLLNNVQFGPATNANGATGIFKLTGRGSVGK